MSLSSFVCTQLNGFKHYNKKVTIKYKLFVNTQLNDRIVLFLTIQFSISHYFGESLNFKQFYLTLTGATTSDQSERGSNGDEMVCRIPQSSTTGVSSSDSFVSYPGHSLGRSLTPLRRCSRCIPQPQPTRLPNLSEDNSLVR